MSSTARAASAPSVFGRFLTSTVGLKMLMAVTGVIWVGFVVGHMVGNLQIFWPMPTAEPHPLNRYAHFLQSLGGILWIVRAVLLACFVAHIYAALRLSALNQAARPLNYKVKKNLQASPTSYYMLLSGLVLLAFLIYHVAHLTVGVGVPGGFDHTNVYGNVIASFSVWWITAIYMLAQIALGLHLYHGTWSLFQTLGLNHPRYNAMRRTLATGLSGLVLIGNISIPVSVLTGIVS